MSNPKSAAALRRKIERLEAQLKAAQDLNLRIGASDMQMVRRNTEMDARMKQAARLLSGEEEL